MLCQREMSPNLGMHPWGEARNQTGNVGSFLDSSTSLLMGSGSFWRLGLVSCQGRSLICSKIPSPHVLACLQLSSHPLVTQSAFRMGPRDPHGYFQVAHWSHWPDGCLAVPPYISALLISESFILRWSPAS